MPTAAPRSRASGTSSTGLAIARCSLARGDVHAGPRRCVLGATPCRPSRLDLLLCSCLARTCLIALFWRCDLVRIGADWFGLMPDQVEGWVRALGFPLFSLSPDPPDLLELRALLRPTASYAGDPEECRRADGSPQEPGIGNVFDGSGDRAVFSGAGGRSRGA